MFEEFSSFFIMSLHNTFRLDPELVVRGLVVPDQQADPDPLLRLVLQELPEAEVAAVGQRPGRLPDQLDLVVDGPPDNIYQMVRFEYGVAYVLPARPVFEHPPLVELDLRQLPLPDVCVLVELDIPAVPGGEVGVDGEGGGGGGGDGGEVEGEEESGFRSQGFSVGAEDGEPAAVDGGEEGGGGDGDGADELGAEGVVVLDVEEEVRGGVGEGDEEALVPEGVLRVGDDAGAGDGGAGDRDGHVGVAGDDLRPVAAGVGVRFVFFVVVGLGGGAAADGAADAQALREEVHVGEVAGLVDLELEVAMEEDDRSFVRGGGVGIVFYFFSVCHGC